MDKNLIIEILKAGVTPALGCTEPGAVAYAVARAKEILDKEVTELDIWVDKNILKNGMDVGIPGTKEKGIIFAAALSLVCGKPQYKLEVLKDSNNEDIEKAYEIVNKKVIKLNLQESTEGLYIKVVAKGQGEEAGVVIKNNHLNIVSEEKNGKIFELLEDTNINNEREEKNKNYAIKNRIKEFSIDQLIEFSDDVNYSDIEFINEGIEMNKRIAFIGVNEELGIGIGKLLKNQANDSESLAKALTAAASEARMSGYPLPVMSSAGSGNHGLVAILPIAIIGVEKGIDRDKIVRAVTLSHLITAYVKVYTGALSAVCGCGVAAGVGCSAGLTYLMGGNKQQIKGSIKNMIAGLTGMICDGAKIGCSYKLSISVASAIEASKLALNNLFIPSDNGILTETAEQTIENLGRVSMEGMNNTDDVILDVMLKKCI
ncbi:L-serine ammonia-lyase, iron-sulfur-dependent, subunit alpha [uncultured Clostridium sp.]|uniref:L-cysteine desulfidase family protein n=1 Tax=uncultured Clostridium sp. TaxID=59620 RepID=UPI0028E30CA6|nr:L-serine ammonia-lyase, iron-sulfur-dependent, subunit alpha [uncultured Clostridium sp.]